MHSRGGPRAQAPQQRNRQGAQSPHACKRCVALRAAPPLRHRAATGAALPLRTQLTRQHARAQMATFAALRIDPYTRTATVVRLPATPPGVEAPGALYRYAADANHVPRQHWRVLAPLVHAGRTDNYVISAGTTMDLGVRQVYTHTEHRGMLWTRDDTTPAGTPERDAIPGFVLLDSAQPGVYWNGCAYLVLYRRDGLQTIDNLAFLEVTARAAVGWERVPGVAQLSRMILTLDQPGRPVTSYTVPSCAACGVRVDEHPRRCAACQRVYYCGRACQLAHWREHRALCRAAVAAAAAAE